MSVPVVSDRLQQREVSWRTRDFSLLLFSTSELPEKDCAVLYTYTFVHARCGEVAYTTIWRLSRIFLHLRDEILDVELERRRRGMSKDFGHDWKHAVELNNALSCAVPPPTNRSCLKSPPRSQRLSAAPPLVT